MIPGCPLKRLDLPEKLDVARVCSPAARASPSHRSEALRITSEHPGGQES